MKLHQLFKRGLLSVLCAMAFVLPSKAIDLAEAAAVMAEVESMAVHAKANLASAALGGDTDAVAEAQKRSDAIDAAVAAVRTAYAQFERDFTNGDMDAAATSGDDMAGLLVQVKDALMGAVPEVAMDQSQEAGDEEMAGGAPGDPNDPPNIYEVPWKSQGIKAYYQGLFGEFWNASAFGHGQGFGDRDATPE